MNLAAPPARAHFLDRCADESVGRFVWRTVRAISYVDSTGRVWTVPQYFLTDFASVPRLLWPLVPIRDGIYDVCAVLHDYLVRNRRKLGLSLVQCHALFLEALRSCGVAAWKTRAMYGAVWCFNWLAAGPGDGTVSPSLLKRVTVIDLLPA